MPNIWLNATKINENPLHLMLKKSTMEFSEITKLSLLNYARLSYEITIPMSQSQR